MRRIHSAASPSSPSPTTRQMRPTPGAHERADGPRVDQAREREIADRSRADDDGGHSRLRGQGARFGRAASSRCRQRGRETVDRFGRSTSLRCGDRERARCRANARRVVLQGPRRERVAETEAEARAGRAHAGGRRRPATLSELASRSTAPRDAPATAQLGGHLLEHRGSAATNRRSCRARARCSATGAPTAPARSATTRRLGATTVATRASDAQADRPELDRRFRRDADIGIRQRPLEPAAHASREPPARSARERAARAPASACRAAASSRHRAGNRAPRSRAIGSWNKPGGHARASGRRGRARGVRGRDQPAFAHAGTRGGPALRRQRPRRPRRSPRSRAVPPARRATNTTTSTHAATCARTAGKREARVGEQHERLEARERVGRAVGVHGGHRSVVAGVQRLEHVERLATAHLSDDEAIGPHPQRGAHELAHRDPAGALGVRRVVLRAAPRAAARAGARRSPRSSRRARCRESRVESALQQRGLARARGRPLRGGSSPRGPPTGGTRHAAGPASNASSGTARAPNRRMVTHGPSMASGGITAWRREPSGRRASTIGRRRDRDGDRAAPTTRSTSRTMRGGIERRARPARAARRARRTRGRARSASPR